MDKLPTEAQLSLRDDYRKFADHKNSGSALIDLQDGKIVFLNRTYQLNDKLIKEIDEVIEKWMLDKYSDKIEIPVEATFIENDVSMDMPETEKDKIKILRIPFEKYYVNFEWCNNGCEHWVIAKCSLNGYPKIYSKHLGTFLLNNQHSRLFVHNQIFGVEPKYLDWFAEETTFLDGGKNER